MQKLFKRIWPVLLIILLSIPTFYRMLRPGIYSMQDFHLFRLVEFDKCIKDLQIPCRWAPDAGLGYGEPLFNFYGQFAYAVGEIFVLIGLSKIASLKLLFILSLILSGVGMYFLAKKIWKSSWAGFISAVAYIYAPYRAVDVWVRGALPEALSFVLFPLLVLAIEYRNALWFSFLLAVLLLTHNLSLVLFFPILLLWIIYRRFWKAIPAGIGAIFIAAFYILPAVFESKFVTLSAATSGYFDFRGHFATLYQLLLSNFWGYGASVFGPEDGLSLSVGYLQWILSIAIMVIWLYSYTTSKKKNFIILLLLALGWFALFLTHNKSTFIWQILPFMKYIQFPWRFIGVAVFCFSLAIGLLPTLFKKYSKALVILILTSLMILNYSFFREDIWYKVGDSYFTTGAEWDRQRAASIGDYWPDFGHKIPDEPASGEFINYFPGWSAEPDENGLIPSTGAVFRDTPVRTIGNLISLVSLLCLGYFLLF